MATTALIFTWDYLWNPSQYGYGQATRRDNFRLTGLPAGAAFVSATLTVELSDGVDGGGVTMQAPSQGSAVGAGSPTSQISVSYSFWLPTGHVKYRIDVVIAVPDAPNPIQEHGSGRIIVFEHEQFGGRHLVIDDVASDLTIGESGFWNDRISSFAVLNGIWRIYKHIGFQSAFPREFGRGLYPTVSSVGIENDSISSLMAV